MKLFFPETLEATARPDPFAGDEGLAPLRLRHLTPGVRLPFHLFAAVGNAPGEFVLAWPRGRVIPPGVLDQPWGYFAVSEAGEVLAYLLSQVEAGRAGWKLQGLLADTLLVWVQHFFRHEAARTASQVDLARGLIQRLFRELPPGLTLKAVQDLRRHDSGLFSHSVNVCLLALALGPSLGWTLEDRETFTLGALLHDLGMMTLPLDPFQQTESLDDQDWEGIRTHPERGAELLRPLGIFPEELLLMVRQHHEAGDGSGYPWGLAGDAIHPWAQVLHLLDSYEAMTSLRPWRPPLSERQALHLMTTAWRAQGPCASKHFPSFLTFCQTS